MPPPDHVSACVSFGGWDYTDSDASSPNFAAIGYQKGVPMGGDLVLAEQIKDKSPNFLIRAVKDPNGANLDRIQIIKGWRDEEGNLFEKVHDIAWSDNRETGEDGKIGSRWDHSGPGECELPQHNR